MQGKKDLYLCHIICEFGALKALDQFKELKDWMDLNPREVIVLVIEDAAPTQDIKRVIEESGLAEYANDMPVTRRPRRSRRSSR